MISRRNSAFGASTPWKRGFLQDNRFFLAMGLAFNLLLYFAPLTLLMFASGVQTPLAVAGAVNCRPDIAGTAGGLSSSLALVISGSFSILAGFLYAGDFLPIAALIAASAGMSVVTYRMAR